MFFTSWTSNSFEDDASSSTGKSFPNNNFHFRDSSSDSSDGDMTAPTTPISPMSPISPISQSNGITLNNNNNNNSHNTPNLQRRASESITEVIQFKKLPVRRYTLPGKLGLPLSKFWEAGRDSSVQVAMEHCQFGL